MHVPVNRHAFSLPSANGPFVAFQVRADLFPGIEAFARRWLE